jgi:hypothetical protein
MEVRSGGVRRERRRSESNPPSMSVDASVSHPCSEHTTRTASGPELDEAAAEAEVGALAAESATTAVRPDTLASSLAILFSSEKVAKDADRDEASKKGIAAALEAAEAAVAPSEAERVGNAARSEPFGSALASASLFLSASLSLTLCSSISRSVSAAPDKEVREEEREEESEDDQPASESRPGFSEPCCLVSSRAFAARVRERERASP